MSGRKAAKRYAHALHALAVEQGVVAAVAADCAFIVAVLDAAPALRRFLGATGVARSRRAAILEDGFHAQVSPLTWRLILLLDSKRRGGLIEGVCLAFANLEQQRQGIRPASVWTPFGLDAELVQSLQRRAEQLAGGPVALQVGLKPSLIGGFRLRIGDKVYDYSLAASLAALRTSLTTGSAQESIHAA